MSYNLAHFLFLLLLHSFSDCNTNSAVFRMCKESFVKIFDQKTLRRKCYHFLWPKSNSWYGRKCRGADFPNSVPCSIQSEGLELTPLLCFSSSPPLTSNQIYHPFPKQNNIPSGPTFKCKIGWVTNIPLTLQDGWDMTKIVCNQPQQLNL